VIHFERLHPETQIRDLFLASVVVPQGHVLEIPFLRHSFLHIHRTRFVPNSVASNWPLGTTLDPHPLRVLQIELRRRPVTRAAWSSLNGPDSISTRRYSSAKPVRVLAAT
jgi:hypothetical protein